MDEVQDGKPMAGLNQENVVHWSRTAIAAEVGEEVVLMNLPRGRCYGLGPVGTDLWKKMAAPIRIGDLIMALSAEYAAQPGVLEADVLETLDQYVSEGLIEVAS